MSATGVNVLLYRSKTLANGEHPLMLCVTKERRRKYVSMGISLAARYWDFDKSRPKRNCPNRIYIEKYIADKQREYTDKVIELTCEEKAFTANTLVEWRLYDQDRRAALYRANRSVACGQTNRVRLIGTAGIYLAHAIQRASEYLFFRDRCYMA